MSISSEIRRAGPYAGNGVTVNFPFAFKVFSTAEVVVTRTVSGVETVLALTADYTVTLNANQDATPGGTVTMLTAPATGQSLTLTSGVGNLQPTSLANLGGFYPDVLNDSFDRATIQIQQLDERVDRALTLPVSSSGIDTELPLPAPGHLIGWDSAATGLQNYANVISGSSVTSTGSTTPRTLADRFAECTNVMDYGATGDGTTDDTAAIKAAITAAHATTHKRLYFPAGTYSFRQQLIVHSGATWFGDGLDKSVLALNIAAGNIVPIRTNTTSGTKNFFDQTGVALYDLHIKGFDAVLTSTPGQNHSPLMRLWKIDGLTIERCKFSAHRFIMLSLGGVKNFSITNCEFEDWGRTDQLDPSTAAISITSITSASTTATVTTGSAHGYTTGQSIIIAGATQTEYNGTYTITVTGATTFTYTFAGSVTSPATGTITCYPQLTLPANEGGSAIWIGANPTDSTPTTLGTMRGNYFHDSEWSCVYLLGQHLDFSHNRMENTQEGNYARCTDVSTDSESRNITYIGNTHKGVTKRLIAASGFECGAKGVVISNNVFEDCVASAIDLSDTCEDAIVTNNFCLDCATSGDFLEYASITARVTSVTADAIDGITIANNAVRSSAGNHGIRVYRVSGTDTFDNIRIVNNDLVGAAADSADNLTYDSTQFGTNVVIEGNNGAADYVPASATWTPTVDATSGTITTVTTPTAQYVRQGNVVFFTLAITVTDNGTGSGALRFTLPSTALYAGTAVGRNTLNGVAGSATWAASAAQATYNTATGTYPVTSGQILRISGSYLEA